MIESAGHSKVHVGLVPFGDMEHSLIAKIADALHHYAGWQCTTLKRLDIPPYAFDLRRKKFNSTILLELLIRLRAYPGSRILGITDHDIFKPDLNFVFGQAEPEFNVAVISLARLHESFYGKRENTELFTRRVVTEAVHEIGHTFGLPHCAAQQCVMFFSYTLDDTDTKGFQFCSKCMKLLEQKGNRL